MTGIPSYLRFPITSTNDNFADPISPSDESHLDGSFSDSSLDSDDLDMYEPEMTLSSEELSSESPRTLSIDRTINSPTNKSNDEPNAEFSTTSTPSRSMDEPIAEHNVEQLPSTQPCEIVIEPIHSDLIALTRASSSASTSTSNNTLTSSDIDFMDESDPEMKFLQNNKETKRSARNSSPKTPKKTVNHTSHRKVTRRDLSLTGQFKINLKMLNIVLDRENAFELPEDFIEEEEEVPLISDPMSSSSNTRKRGRGRPKVHPKQPAPSAPQMRKRNSNSLNSIFGDTTSDQPSTSKDSSEISPTPVEYGNTSMNWSEGSYINRCMCGLVHNDSFMIECERCKTWQHAICMGIEKTDVAFYLCELCEPKTMMLTPEEAKIIQETKMKERETKKLLKKMMNKVEETKKGSPKKSPKKKAVQNNIEHVWRVPSPILMSPSKHNLPSTSVSAVNTSASTITAIDTENPESFNCQEIEITIDAIPPKLLALAKETELMDDYPSHFLRNPHFSDNSADDDKLYYVPEESDKEGEEEDEQNGSFLTHDELLLEKFRCGKDKCKHLDMSKVLEKSMNDEKVPETAENDSSLPAELSSMEDAPSTATTEPSLLENEDFPDKILFEKLKEATKNRKDSLLYTHRRQEGTIEGGETLENAENGPTPNFEAMELEETYTRSPSEGHRDPKSQNTTPKLGKFSIEISRTDVIVQQISTGRTTTLSMPEATKRPTKNPLQVHKSVKKDLQQRPSFIPSPTIAEAPEKPTKEFTIRVDETEKNSITTPSNPEILEVPKKLIVNPPRPEILDVPKKSTVNLPRPEFLEVPKVKLLDTIMFRPSNRPIVNSNILKKKQEIPHEKLPTEARPLEFDQEDDHADLPVLEKVQELPQTPLLMKKLRLKLVRNPTNETCAASVIRTPLEKARSFPHEPTSSSFNSSKENSTPLTTTSVDPIVLTPATTTDAQMFSSSTSVFTPELLAYKNQYKEQLISQISGQTPQSTKRRRKIVQPKLVPLGSPKKASLSPVKKRKKLDLGSKLPTMVPLKRIDNSEISVPKKIPLKTGGSLIDSLVEQISRPTPELPEELENFLNDDFGDHMDMTLLSDLVQGPEKDASLLNRISQTTNESIGDTVALQEMEHGTGDTSKSEKSVKENNHGKDPNPLIEPSFAKSPAAVPSTNTALISPFQEMTNSTPDTSQNTMTIEEDASIIPTINLASSSDDDIQILSPVKNGNQVEKNFIPSPRLVTPSETSPLINGTNESGTRTPTPMDPMPRAPSTSSTSISWISSQPPTTTTSSSHLLQALMAPIKSNQVHASTTWVPPMGKPREMTSLPSQPLSQACKPPNGASSGPQMALPVPTPPNGTSTNLLFNPMASNRTRNQRNSSSGDPTPSGRTHMDPTMQMYLKALRYDNERREYYILMVQEKSTLTLERRYKVLQNYLLPRILPCADLDVPVPLRQPFEPSEEAGKEPLYEAFKRHVNQIRGAYNSNPNMKHLIIGDTLYFAFNHRVFANAEMIRVEAPALSKWLWSSKLNPNLANKKLLDDFNFKSGSTIYYSLSVDFLLYYAGTLETTLQQVQLELKLLAEFCTQKKYPDGQKIHFRIVFITVPEYGQFEGLFKKFNEAMRRYIWEKQKENNFWIQFEVLDFAEQCVRAMNLDMSKLESRYRLLTQQLKRFGVEFKEPV